MREKLANLMLSRLELRIRDTHPLRDMTPEQWKFLVEVGAYAHIPTKNLWRTCVPDPTRLQLFKLWVARKLMARN